MGNPADLEFSKDAKVTEFATRLKAFQGKPLDGQSIWSLTQYPYVFALADAMTSAGSVTDTDAIIAKLRGYKNDKIVSLQIGDTGEVITQVDVSTSVGPDVSVVSVHP
jgi:hypothetical protein